MKRPQCGRQPRKFLHIDTNAARYVMVLGENGGVVLQRSSRKLGRKDEEAEKIRRRCGWRGERTHPPAAAAQSRPPGAAKIRGESVPPRPNHPFRLAGSSTESKRPGSSRAANQISTRTLPGSSSSLSPSSSPSSRAPEPPSSPSPLRRVEFRQSGGAEGGGGCDGKQRRKRGDEVHCAENPSRDALYGTISEWLTCGPRQSCQIPQQSRAWYVAKKMARESRRPA